ncbi:MAG: hypothetical protein KC415_04870 [Anaerolineales bacterium]|nr:hypothetical protein [Anaerolineales bacterium]
MDIELGYHFYPSEIGHPMAHSRLDISLFAHPTQRHYDPERADFRVMGLDGGREHLTLSHNWHGPRDYRVCAGRILLHDRKGKLVEAFSFGGKLTIINQDDLTLCTLTSTAPILNLVTSQTAVTRLVSEFEALLARQEAAWVHHPFAFQKKLASLEPDRLFAAGLLSMSHAYAEIPPNARNGNIREEDHIVHELIAALKKHSLWPADLQNLETLLAES